MEAEQSLRLRRATGADARAVASVHVTSWQSAYRGMLPAAFLEGLDIDQRASLYQFDGDQSDDPVTWIAVDDDDVVGFVVVGAYRDDDAEGVGEIRALYVSSSRWRSGVGTLPLNKGESLLREKGFIEATLWVLEANERGCRFYEAVGWRSEERSNTLNIAGVEVEEIRYSKAPS